MRWGNAAKPFSLPLLVMSTIPVSPAAIGTSKLDWLISTPCKESFSRARDEGFRRNTVPPIVCADGASLSVQASRTHFCSPQNSNGPWDTVEVGFPSVAVPEWAGFKHEVDGPDSKAVFGGVPVALVRAFIAAHGGEK